MLQRRGATEHRPAAALGVRSEEQRHLCWTHRRCVRDDTAHGYALRDASQPFFDRALAIGFDFSLYSSTVGDCSTMLDLVNSGGLVFSTAHRLILMAA